MSLIGSRIGHDTKKYYLAWDFCTMNTDLSGIWILNGKFIMTFLLNGNSIFGGLALTEKVDAVFVFVLDLVWGRGVREYIFDNNNHLIDNFRGILCWFFNKIKPLDFEPISFFPIFILKREGIYFGKIFSIISIKLTILYIISILFFIDITFIKSTFYITIYIIKNNLNIWTFFVSC
jgi:hypothetical protein